MVRATGAIAGGHLCGGKDGARRMMCRSWGWKAERLRTTTAKATLLSVDQAGACRAQVGSGVVPELGDQRVPFQPALDHAPLHAAPAAVNQTHMSQSGGVGGRDVFVDDRCDVAWCERVQIQFRLDRDFVGHA
jgi:hypothetical protein